MRHLATNTPHKTPISMRSAFLIDRTKEKAECFISNLSRYHATYQTSKAQLEKVEEDSTLSHQDKEKMNAQYRKAHREYHQYLQSVESYQEELKRATLLARTLLFQEGSISPEICHAYRYENYIDCTPEEKLPSYDTIYIGCRIEEKIDAMNTTAGTQQTED